MCPNSSQIERVQPEPKMLSLYTLVYQLKMSIPLRSPYQAKTLPAFLLKICKVSLCLRGGLAVGNTCHYITQLSWASRWMFNSSGGYASCRYATASH